eukprot:CAMPEP_0117757056 /NCGR_PEP_ID=MMETSP0947-20121206/14484_1 /TAXON_ID=44440 /ORGANISM="Chattonella subsalsa, Strain CCMP2191" /LENGTH=149 /DNA_ID=CAMNT_0005576837 /DNA_START=162 /DNA_END=611 /DNA_ORIENTATION=-
MQRNSRSLQAQRLLPAFEINEPMARVTGLEQWMVLRNWTLTVEAEEGSRKKDEVVGIEFLNDWTLKTTNGETGKWSLQVKNKKEGTFTFSFGNVREGTWKKYECPCYGGRFNQYSCTFKPGEYVDGKKKKGKFSLGMESLKPFLDASFR